MDCMQIVNNHNKNEFATHEELLETISHIIKKCLWLRVELELNGFVSESRWNKFNDFTEELKKAYKDVKKDME